MRKKSITEEQIRRVVRNVLRECENRLLAESSINRVMRWLYCADCAFITGFRDKITDVLKPREKHLGGLFLGKESEGGKTEYPLGQRLTHEQKRDRNKALNAKLMALGYGVIKVKGVYPEGMNKEASEESYLVFNPNDDGNFFKNLFSLSYWMNQDSFYYKPKGSEYGYLVGTNAAEYPGFKQKGAESKFMATTASNYMSRVGNSSFSFVGRDAVRNRNKKEAMNQIADEYKSQGFAIQHYWQDREGTSFHDRKSNRRNANESVFVFILGKMLTESITTYETMHPRTRWAMSNFINNYKLNENLNPL